MGCDIGRPPWPRALSLVVVSLHPVEKKPESRQHRLNSSPLPHGHNSLRPSRSWSSLSPWTTRRPRLTWVSLRVASTPLGYDLERRSRHRRSPVAWPTSFGMLGIKSFGGDGCSARTVPEVDNAKSIKVRGERSRPGLRSPFWLGQRLSTALRTPQGMRLRLVSDVTRPTGAGPHSKMITS